MIAKRRKYRKKLLKQKKCEIWVWKPLNKVKREAKMASQNQKKKKRASGANNMTFLKDWNWISTKVGGAEVKKTRISNGEESERSWVEFKSLRTRGKSRATAERQSIAATAAATAAKYEYGFSATTTAANPGTYVLVTKVCRQIELLVKFFKNVLRSETVAYSSLFLNGFFVLYLLKVIIKSCINFILEI